jgi:hypothetical protein
MHDNPGLLGLAQPQGSRAPVASRSLQTEEPAILPSLGIRPYIYTLGLWGDMGPCDPHGQGRWESSACHPMA